MSKFKKKANTKQEIPTSSMPDVVFMLLFFFMVTTKMRETNINVEQHMPQAVQLQTLAKKSLKGVIQWVNSEKAKLDEVDRDAITISLKVDTEAKRGLIADVETELRRANARKLLYSANKKIDR